MVSYRIVIIWIVWIVWLAASGLYAEDLALSIRAQTDFGRVELAVRPSLGDALACVQSQAAVLPVTAPGDLSLIHFRKGYCMLVEGMLRRDAGEDRQAEGEFRQAIQAWPEKTKGEASPAPRVLAAIAELKAGGGIGGREWPRGGEDCPANLMPVGECRELLKTGRMWQAWIAAREDHWAEAARMFQEFPESGWPAWIGGRQAFEAGRYGDAATLLEQAARVWSSAEKNAPAPIATLLQPAPDMAQALAQLGEAQLLSGQYTAAIASFDAAHQRAPGDAWAIFLRGRAKGGADQSEGALADYELASRTAFAEVDAPFSSGQAHFYRGVRYFERQDYARAEEELASALNFGPGPRLRPDVLAWWRMAAVAGGACHSSIGLLEESLAAVSDFFPKQEARNLIQLCR